MPSHYWMVLINIILFLVALIVSYFLIRKSPKTKINYPFLLLIFSLLPCISIFRFGSYESGDFIQHIYRVIVFYDALKEGILIPSWAAALNGGYGYPVFIFIYLVPYYIMSTLHALGFSFILSGKILLVSAYILSGYTMYLLLKKITANSFAAFSGAIVYLFSPYHLVDLHFRVAMAEIIAFTITPILLLFLINIWQTKKYIYIALSGLLIGILFLTHPAQFIFYSGIFILYFIYKCFIIKKIEVIKLLYISFAFLIGLALSSFSWIARFTLTQYTHGSQLVNIHVSFAQPLDLLFSPWRYGFLFQGSHGELSFLIGYTQIFLVLLVLCLIILKKFNKNKYNELYFWTSISVFSIFCMLPYSKFLWDTIPFLNLMQFAYRLLHPLIFSLAIITAFLTLRYKSERYKIYIFLIITIAYTMLNWGHRHMLPNIDDSWVRNNVVNTTKNEEGMIEANPLWFNPKKNDWIQDSPKEPLTIVSGNVEYKELSRTSVTHTYMIYAHKHSSIVENTFYFPNWEIRIDNKPVEINYTSKEYPARMLFNVPPGLHYLEVKYRDILALEYAKIVSFLTFIILLIYISIHYIKKFRHKSINEIS